MIFFCFSSFIGNIRKKKKKIQKIWFMLIWVKWKQVKKILHDKTYTRRENENVDFFPFSFPARRRDEMWERWRNRFSHPISHKIKLWARLISSRLPLIDITFSTSYFCFYFSSIFMIFSSSSLVVVFSSNHQHHHRLLARSLIWLRFESTVKKKDSSVEIEKSNC